MKILYVGDPGKKTAYSFVNRGWIEALRYLGHEVMEMSNSAAASRAEGHIVIHHDYEEDFSTVTPPEHGHLVAARTWDFGPYPPAWVEFINATCRQLWVYSSWTREQAIHGGIDPDRVRVIPPIVDTDLFSPSAEKNSGFENDGFQFLFVGAAVYRKGIDLLLQAYDKAFRTNDDVCLLVKDHPSDVFYRQITEHEALLRRSKQDSGPDVRYLNRFLTIQDLVGLYRRSDVGVFPYRAEGFAAPILEAMACGIPTIVPEFGACLDYCSPENAFLVPARRIQLPVLRSFAINTLGFEEQVEEVDFCELPIDALAEAMREVWETRDLVQQKGRLARDSIVKSFTLQAVAQRMEQALDELSE